MICVRTSRVRSPVMSSAFPHCDARAQMLLLPLLPLPLPLLLLLPHLLLGLAPASPLVRG